jgi:hypothetical protein
VLIENTDPLLSGRNWFSYTFTDCRCGHAHLVKSEDKEFDFIEYYSRRLFCPGQFKIAYELFSRAKVMLPSGGRLMIVGKLRKVSTQSIPALVGK